MTHFIQPMSIVAIGLTTVMAACSDSSAPRLDHLDANRDQVSQTQSTIAFVGDSLTEGFGVSATAAYPSLIEKELLRKGRSVRVVNAGIGGSTSASAPARMKWILRNKPSIVVLALGANDGLRGLSIQMMEKNLDDAIQAALKSNVKVLLVGMKTPPNYGSKYAREFEAVFPKLAKKHRLPLVPFLLDGVAGSRKFNLPDGIHPNEQGHRKMAETILDELERHKWL